MKLHNYINRSLFVCTHTHVQPHTHRNFISNVILELCACCFFLLIIICLQVKLKLKQAKATQQINKNQMMQNTNANTKERSKTNRRRRRKKKRAFIEDNDRIVSKMQLVFIVLDNNLLEFICAF